MPPRRAGGQPLHPIYALTFNIRLYNQADQLLLEFEPVFTMPKRGG